MHTLSLTTVVDCGPLTAPANGNVVVQSTTFGSTASYSCVLGYILEGPEERFCGVDGQWSDTEPVCTCKLILKL